MQTFRSPTVRHLNCLQKGLFIFKGKKEKLIMLSVVPSCTQINIRAQLQITLILQFKLLFFTILNPLHNLQQGGVKRQSQHLHHFITKFVMKTNSCRPSFISLNQLWSSPKIYPFRCCFCLLNTYSKSEFDRVSYAPMNVCFGLVKSWSGSADCLASQAGENPAS